MRRFLIGGTAYQAGKIRPMEQAKLVKALAPILGTVFSMQEFMGAAVKASEQIKAGQDTSSAVDAAKPSSDKLAEIIQTMMESFHKMSDEDMEKVFDITLSVVTRCNAPDPDTVGASWQPIWVSEAKQPLFADIEFPTMVLIAYNVILGSLGNFSLGGLSR